MAKVAYLLTISVLGILALLFLGLNFIYSPIVLDKNIKVTTDRLIRNTPKLILENNYDNTSSYNIANIGKSNMFDPSRAASAELASGGQLKNVELLGVFVNGPVKGALLSIDNNQQNQGMPYNNYQNNYYNQQNNYQQGANGLNAADNTPVKQKMMFKVGDRLPNGMILSSVGIDYAVLNVNGEQIKIKIAYDSDASMNRMNAVNGVNNNNTLPVNIVEPGGASNGANNQQSQFVTTGNDGNQTGQGFGNQQTPSYYRGYGR